MDLEEKVESHCIGNGILWIEFLGVINPQSSMDTGSKKPEQSNTANKKAVRILKKRIGQ